MQGHAGPPVQRIEQGSLVAFACRRESDLFQRMIRIAQNHAVRGGYTDRFTAGQAQKKTASTEFEQLTAIAGPLLKADGTVRHFPAGCRDNWWQGSRVRRL